MTGRYGHNTGIRANGATSPVTVFNQSTSLQHRLQQALFHDGGSANDPARAPLQQQVGQDSACAGATGP
jgi:hypothetical protein